MNIKIQDKQGIYIAQVFGWINYFFVTFCGVFLDADCPSSVLCFEPRSRLGPPLSLDVRSWQKRREREEGAKQTEEKGEKGRRARGRDRECGCHCHGQDDNPGTQHPGSTVSISTNEAARIATPDQAHPGRPTLGRHGPALTRSLAFAQVLLPLRRIPPGARRRRHGAAAAADGGHGAVAAAAAAAVSPRSRCGRSVAMAALPGGGHHTLGPLDTDGIGIGGCGKAAAIGGQGAAAASMNGGGDGRRTSVVLVKLTDASLRSLEDYVRRRQVSQPPPPLEEEDPRVRAAVLEPSPILFQARRSHHLSRRGGCGGHASPSSEETAAEGAPAIRFPSGQHELGVRQERKHPCIPSGPCPALRFCNATSASVSCLFAASRRCPLISIVPACSMHVPQAGFPLLWRIALSPSSPVSLQPLGFFVRTGEQGEKPFKLRGKKYFSFGGAGGRTSHSVCARRWRRVVD